MRIKSDNALGNVENEFNRLKEELTVESFTKAYTAFIDQAEKNLVTKKANGKRIPEGLSNTFYQGANISQHFGQGAASKTPYLNWGEVSIYYLIDTKDIVIGVELDKYPELEVLAVPIGYRKIGARKKEMPIFYSSTKETINLVELYDKFLDMIRSIMIAKKMAF